jgi:hypothetical protein
LPVVSATSKSVGDLSLENDRNLKLKYLNLLNRNTVNFNHLKLSWSEKKKNIKTYFLPHRKHEKYRL